MALWGVSDADESKPKYLSDADKKNCIAKSEGWVLKKTVGSRNLEEILVATGADLSVGIGQADITEIDFLNLTDTVTSYYPNSPYSVSYTHLTLPTNREV